MRGRPRGSRDALGRLWSAIERVEQADGVDWFESVVRAALADPRLALPILTRLVPQRVENRITEEGLEEAIEKIVDAIERLVPDDATRKALADEIAQIDSGGSGGSSS